MYSMIRPIPVSARIPDMGIAQKIGDCVRQKIKADPTDNSTRKQPERKTIFLLSTIIPKLSKRHNSKSNNDSPPPDRKTASLSRKSMINIIIEIDTM